MAAECLAAIRLCRVRVTRLDATGVPIAGPNNSYVSDKPIQINVTPNIEQGQDRVLTGGCDCILAEYRGFDKIKRYDFEYDQGLMEPGLLEMMIGGSAIMASGFPIGNWFPDNQFDCSSVVQPNVCFEGWQSAWNVDQPDVTYPFIRWIWPSTFWTLGQFTLQNDFNQPKLHGFSRRNTNWGTGIYHDQPEAAKPQGGWFYDTAMPAASCGYLSHAIT